MNGTNAPRYSPLSLTGRSDTTNAHADEERLKIQR
jgi:hypothetical protein